MVGLLAVILEIALQLHTRPAAVPSTTSTAVFVGTHRRGLLLGLDNVQRGL